MHPDFWKCEPILDEQSPFVELVNLGGHNYVKSRTAAPAPLDARTAHVMEGGWVEEAQSHLSIRHRMAKELLASARHPQDGTRAIDPLTGGLHQSVQVNEILENIASERGLTRLAVLELIDALIAGRIIKVA
jgi:hypothetical protein